MTLEQKVREILIVVRNTGNTKTAKDSVDIATEQIMENIKKEYSVNIKSMLTLYYKKLDKTNKLNDHANAILFEGAVMVLETLAINAGIEI